MFIDAVKARAMAAPTRQAILAFVDEADGPVSVAELTDHLELNHNAVRKHLRQLVDAGLLVEAHEARTGPGRPKLVYELAPSLTSSGGASYERLAVLLAAALTEGEQPREVGRRAGAIPCTAAERDRAPIDVLAARLEADGFEPVIRRRGGTTTVVLDRCPFVAAAEANPAAVCQLHLGLLEGAADAIGGLTVEGLVPHDPRRAGCRVAVRD
jgi:predicted ArsR family transcriptional regulator